MRESTSVVERGDGVVVARTKQRMTEIKLYIRIVSKQLRSKAKINNHQTLDI